MLPNLACRQAPGRRFLPSDCSPPLQGYPREVRVYRKGRPQDRVSPGPRGFAYQKKNARVGYKRDQPKKRDEKKAPQTPQGAMFLSKNQDRPQEEVKLKKLHEFRMINFAVSSSSRRRLPRTMVGHLQVGRRQAQLARGVSYLYREASTEGGGGERNKTEGRGI